LPSTPPAPAPVLHHEGLAQARRHAFGDDAADDVVAAAGGEGNDQADRPVRKPGRLGEGATARERERGGHQ
jgi:hypothetical protein